MIFCTQCGHKNVDDALFCEECGHSLTKAPPISAPAPAPVTNSSSGKSFNTKSLVSITGGVVGLIALVAGISIFLAPPSASNATFTKAIDKYLLAKPLMYKDRYCLDNFPYDLSEVSIDPNDYKASVLLEVLSKAGIYGEPVEAINRQRFFEVRILKYTKTAAGSKATQGSKLCVADGVSVARMESFTPPEKSGETQTSRVSVELKLVNPLPFVSTGELTSILPNLKPEFDSGMVLFIKDGAWQVADDQAIRMLSQNEPRKSSQQVSANEGNTGSFIGKLPNFFSFGSNPVLGKWRANLFGMPVEFEFQSDSMVTPQGRMQVRYEVRGSEVTIYEKGSSKGDTITVTDADHLVMRSGGEKLKLVRVK